MKSLLSIRTAGERAVLCALGMAAGSTSKAVQADYMLHAAPGNMIYGYFWGETPPVLKVKSGQIVTIDTTDLTGITAEHPEQFFIDHHVSLDLDGVKDLIAVKKGVPPSGIQGHMMTGPIYIEGAEPGDTLEVRLLSIKTRVPYCMNMSRPGGGGVPDLVPRPYQKFIPLDLDRQVAVYSDKIEVPMHPFEGVMAVAPVPQRGKLSSRPPYEDIGGNMDNKDLCEGTTVYFPVQVKGAIFYIGDPHAGQGDGEVSGSAMESSNRVSVQLIVRKDMHIKLVQAESPKYYYIFGMDTELNTAMHKAIANSIEFMEQKEGLNFIDALSLNAIGVDYAITEVVDVTKGIHAKIPKSIFKDVNPADYWYKGEEVTLPPSS